MLRQYQARKATSTGLAVVPGRYPCRWSRARCSGSPPSARSRPEEGAAEPRVRPEQHGDSSQPLASACDADVHETKSGAGATVEKGEKEERATDLHLGDAGASEGGAEEVAALVDGVGADDREHIILHKVLLPQPHHRRQRRTRQRNCREDWDKAKALLG
eukprot:2970317-Rhodomonas_salina.1